jgi:hypothetical protein
VWREHEALTNDECDQATRRVNLWDPFRAIGKILAQDQPILPPPPPTLSHIIEYKSLALDKEEAARCLKNLTSQPKHDPLLLQRRQCILLSQNALVVLSLADISVLSQYRHLRVANFSDQHRVCDSCYRAYRTIDKARQQVTPLVADCSIVSKLLGNANTPSVLPNLSPNLNPSLASLLALRHPLCLRLAPRAATGLSQTGSRDEFQTVCSPRVPSRSSRLYPHPLGRRAGGRRR